MRLNPTKIKTKDRLYSTNQLKYFVILNTRLEEYEEMELLSDEHLPNYLILNNDTGAIEFAVDQLPAAVQVANKLENELLQLMAGIDTSEEDKTVRVVQ